METAGVKADTTDFAEARVLATAVWERVAAHTKDAWKTSLLPTCAPSPPPSAFQLPDYEGNAMDASSNVPTPVPYMGGSVSTPIQISLSERIPPTGD
jgi:hypothetical protein